MGKRNATESLEHSAATPATPKRQRLQDAVDLKPVVTETPPQTYTLTKELVEDTVLLDLNLQKWRVGQPVGKGSFGEIFLASDDISRPVTESNAKYVVKIEPHSNGPLFVEIHCLMNTAKVTEDSPLPDGMPEYIASGSHLFRNEKYRFLILPRFQYDLHSVLKHHKRLDPKNLLVVASQILDILQHLHDHGYVHSDIKAENLMVGNPADVRRRRQLRTLAVAGTSASTSSISSASSTMTLSTKGSTVKMEDVAVAQGRKNLPVEFSGSNPVRKCRVKSGVPQETSQSYNEMVSSHYLRPLKQINYFDDSDASSDALAAAAATTAATVNGVHPPEVYNSNSNISVMSNGSSCSLASSSGISSIAQNTVNGGRNRRKPTVNGQQNKQVARGRGRKATKRGKLMEPKFRAISEDEEEEELEEEDRDRERERDRIYLIDFGLASKFVDTTGAHRPFFMDERRAHDGTLEFTSRDAHLGAHARRSDLECLGYNLICWSQGNLPWRNEKMLQQPEAVHHMKEFFMSNVKETLKLCYGPQVPKFLGVYMEYVNQLMYTDRPDYDYCRSIFANEFKRLGFDLKSEFHLDLEPLRNGKVKVETEEAQQEVVKKEQMPVTSTVAKEAKPIGRVRRTGRRRNAKDGKENGDVVDGEVNGGTPQQQCNEQLLAKFGLMVPTIKDSSSKISPKNLRSKKAAPKKKRRKLSWEELLATDPEQISRQRIEKELDEQDSNLEVSIKYQGKPTYAILELENKLNNTVNGGEDASMVSGVNGLNESFLEVSPIKGYTKPMMDIVRRRHSNLIRSLTESREEEEEEEGEEEEEEEEEEEVTAKKNGLTAKVTEKVQSPPAVNGLMTTPRRRKAGLRQQVKRTSKSLFYHKNFLKKKLTDVQVEEEEKQREVESSSEEEEEEESVSESESEEDEEEDEEEEVKKKSVKKRTSGGSTKKKYEEDSDWDLDQSEAEVEEDPNDIIDDEDQDSEDEDEEEEEDSEMEEDEDEEDQEESEEEDEEMASDDNHSEESNSCDRVLGSKRNTRLKRWNGTEAASNGFTETGKGQRMITRG